MKPERLISVVDDDESLRESLDGLLRSLGYAVAVFESAEAFLKSPAVLLSQCLILDISMPGMNGPELQRELIARSKKIPIVFITAHGDEAIALRVKADGAIDCLLKPFSEPALLGALDRALANTA